MALQGLHMRSFCFALFLMIGFQAVMAQSYEIGKKSIQPTDTARNGRNVPTEVFYPAPSAGSNVPVANSPDGFPLLVFGHGFSMNYNPYGNLREELVKSGYIMVFPKTEVGPVPFPDHGAFGKDMAFLARLFLRKDSLTSSDFYQRLNGEVAAMGHSMGGGCSFLAVKDEPSFTALATLAPAETNVSAIGAANAVNVPSLVFAGSKDCVTPIEDHQQPIYDTLASNWKTLAVIEQGTHCYFANANTACDLGSNSCQPNSNITRNEQHQRLFTLLTPWLNFHLKNTCTAYDTVQETLADASTYQVQRVCDYQLPEANVLPGDTAIFCPGDSVTFSTLSAFSQYKWKTGDTTRELTVSDTGRYRVAVSDSLGCTDTSGLIHVTNRPSFAKPTVTNGKATLCAGDSLTLSLTGSYRSYHWSNGDTSRSVTTDQPGDYWVRATNQKGCEGFSDTVSVQELSPLTPVLQQEGDTLITGFFPSYQWYRDGMPIQGADEPSIALQDSGRYYVEVTDTNGCNSYSDTLLFQPEPSGVVDPAKKKIIVAPVPADKKLQVKANIPLSEDTRIDLISMDGQQVVRSTRWPSHERYAVVNVQDLPTGVYLVRIMTAGHSRTTRKVVIE